MDYESHVAAVEREVAGMADGVAAGPLDAAVPTCPDWTVTDLMAHVGDFTSFWTHVLCEGSGRPKTPVPSMPNDGSPEKVGQWYAGLGDMFVTELQATAPDQAVWTWVPERNNAAFVARRGANELAVHRFDLESARGDPRPLGSALAADAIEEIFVMVAAYVAENEQAGKGTGETLLLRATDRPEAWRIVLTPDGTSVERAAGMADLELEGAVSDLALLLYDRPTLGPVVRRGDEAALAAWYRAFHFG